MSARTSPRVDTAGAAEEWVDARVHRPLAQGIVRLLIGAPITPNQITGVACLLGVLAALLLYLGAGTPQFRLIAGGLLFAAVVFDCADGQLARARQAASRTGDMLDGLADVVVNVCMLGAVTYVAAVERGDSRIWALGAAAMASYGVQCSLFDFAKRAYLSRAGIKPLPTEEDDTQVQQARERAARDGRWGEAFLLWFYGQYFATLRKITAALPGISMGESNPRRMQAWTWLGLGTHLAMLYTAVAVSSFWPPALIVCLAVFCTLQNAWLAGLLA
jgi:hypothetical protein